MRRLCYKKLELSESSAVLVMYCLIRLVLLALTTSGVSAIPLEDFYPFGDSAGDTSVLDRGHPCNFVQAIPLSGSFPFFRTDYVSLIVRNLASK